ncbi:MAG: PadR family transcriptional regulator [Pseudonocardiaceae bacterium]
MRTALLLLLAEQPMHGYQLMQAITERTSGAWRPSPGAVYPTLSQLEDEGLIDIVGLRLPHHRPAHRMAKKSSNTTPRG